MHSRVKYCFLITCFIWANAAAAQMRASLGADFMILRNFSAHQHYMTIGQTIRGEWKGNNMRIPVYAWFGYTNLGKFENKGTAMAINPATSPQQIAFTNHAEMRHSHLSLGLKPYLKGAWDAEEGWNLYGYAGLGILMAKVNNHFKPAIDTSQYSAPVASGTGRFKRLSLDLGLGFEMPVGGDLFLYGEAKTAIPVSAYPSEFLFNNKYNPLAGSIGVGVRVLF